MYATLDIAIFDLFTGNMEIIKNGSCPTFVKSNKDVQLIKSLSLPFDDNKHIVTIKSEDLSVVHAIIKFY